MKEPTEKWRSLPQDKQMKLYENTLFPHIKHVMQKFTKQLSKEDLKKFAKEIGKKLVASDFKNGRVEDPTKISEKQEKKVKKHVRDYFEKAVEKRKVMDKRKTDQEREREKAKANHASNGVAMAEVEEVRDEETESDVERDMEGVQLSPSNSPIDAPSSSHDTPTASFSDLSSLPSSNSLKRSHESDETSESDSYKRLKEELYIAPPPPPPPPPAEGMPEEMEGIEDAIEVREETEEERELRKQEEDLMRENEEAVLMDMDGSLKTAEEMGLVNGNGNGVSVS